ncbi:MAG: hypothetical protein LUD18_05965 [Lachnospiraceae bacterium]|nr:hypothetical protein [Lachnospiraceae bacterium]
MEKEQEKKLRETQETPSAKEESSVSASKDRVSETWAEETIADLDEYIESQGIYLRQ